MLRRTEQRPSDGTASPPRRGMLELKPTWKSWARDAREARCHFHAVRLTMKNAAHSHAFLVFCISPVSGNKTSIAAAFCATQMFSFALGRCHICCAVTKELAGEKLGEFVACYMRY